MAKASPPIKLNVANLMRLHVVNTLIYLKQPIEYVEYFLSFVLRFEVHNELFS